MTLLSLTGFIDVAGPLFWVVRMAAALGGALAGWVLSGPLVRVLYRLALRRPAPRWVVPWAKLSGAAVLGLLMYFFVPLGGSGGWGFGPGAGGLPGAGSGPGLGKADADKTAAAAKTGTKNDLEVLEIELVGGARYQGDGRFYLIQRRPPAVKLDEVDDYIKKNHDRLAAYVIIVLTPNNSVDAAHAAVLRLNTIIEKYGGTPQIKDVDEEPAQATK